MNLTSTQLNQQALDLLDLGLTYIPTLPLLLRSDTIDDLKKICRRLKLYDFFHHKETGGDEELEDPLSKLFKIRSGWTPKVNQISDPTLKTVSELCDITQNLLNGKTVIKNQTVFTRHHCKPNLTADQSKALRDLRADDKIVIKPADKGSSIVIMEKDLYRKEALRQLTDEKYYRILPGPLQEDTAKKLTPIIDTLRRTGFLTAKQHQHLTPNVKDITSRYFYLLPKVHKKPSSWPHARMPPGRPIVADVGTESSEICKYIDHFLRPLAGLHPAYLKDTYDFLDKVKGRPIEPHWLLFTADVESLYTNMRFDRVLTTIAQMFAEYPDPKRPDWAILKLLDIVMSNNDFEFDGAFYLQILGASMGRSWAPSAANIYLRELDEKAREGLNGTKPVLYFRFLDDIFGLWPGTRQQLFEFESYLNTIIPGIKLTFTIREELIEFLDTRIYRHVDDRGLHTLRTKVYFKPTDTHQLLHRKSHHPTHTFRGIVKSQLIRFKRISSTWYDYQEACAILTRTLVTRGYTKSKLLREKRNVWRNWQEKTPLAKLGEKLDEIIPIVTYYDRFHCRLNRKWKAKIESNPTFDECRVVAAYRRHRNLRDWLVRGRFGPNTADEDPEALLEALVEVLQRPENAV